MKHTTRIFSLVVGVLAACSFSAIAEDGEGKEGKKGGKRGGHRPSPEMIKEFDKDGDGKLNEEERKALRAAMILKRFDEDGSGDLDAEEQAKADEFIAKMKERAKRHRRGGPGGKRPGGKRPRGGEGEGGGERDAPEA